MKSSLSMVLLSFALLSAVSTTEPYAFNWQDDPDVPALLDLRPLNEKFAGEHGKIRLSADGNSFVRGDGSPIRFWTMNCFGKGALVTRSREDWSKQAKFLVSTYPSRAPRLTA